MSRVYGDVRCVVLLLGVLSSTAAADVERVRPVSAGLYFLVHGGSHDGVDVGGYGPSAEISLGANRTQLFVEGGIAWARLGPPAAQVAGMQARGALGARWIARSFDIERVAGVEMLLDTTVGAHKYWFDDGGELARPEISLGAAIQIRKYRRRHVSIRFGFRAFWAPIDRDARVMRCTSHCASAVHSNDGLMMYIGASL